jgi:hypothetical protein
MPQELLPIYPSTGEGYITDLLSLEKLIVNGNCRQVDIVKAFGISPISVKRMVKKYREGGAEAFFKKPHPRSAHVLTPDILQKTQEFLNGELDRAEVASRLQVKKNTLDRVIRAGRLVEPVKKTPSRKAPKANGA